MRTAVFALALALALCGMAAAQKDPALPAQLHSPAPQASPSPAADVEPGTSENKTNHGQFPVFRTGTNEVNLIFTVTDKHGRFIRDLKQSDFKILDDDLPPREVTHFEAETDLPLRVGLLIDASNSIRDRFQFEQQAAIQFLQQIIRPRNDRAFVLAFDEVPDVTQDFTGNLDKLTRGIQVIRPGGGTALWDAVYYACRDKLLKDKEDFPVRRAMILVSDGEDNQSRVLRQEALDMAQRASVIIYTISTNLTSSSVDQGDKNLKMLAEATGGRAFFPFKLQDLADAFHDIQEELRSQYVISYKPDKFYPNGEYRQVKISMADKKKFQIRARKGYYVPKQ
ncbi:MAG TPA: VWA domain-containing protein [Candidatus Angelobacter sp.]|nr:VWA domain-containing protein [Candidatus Angelobacter sp.]